MKYPAAYFGDLNCTHSHVPVSSAHLLSGVNNRNHCPYCLWSSHLDLYAPGDRLSACKGQMKPIGLTMKKGRNKYRLEARGELMLVHQCTGCGVLSINRIAADDHPSAILVVFQESITNEIGRICEGYGILTLKARDVADLCRQLYGSEVTLSMA